MSARDLSPNFDRHRAALDIVDPGASNPSGVALALHDACRQAIAEGAPQREDPAIRLIGLQLAHLLDVARILDPEEYDRLVGQCRARAHKRKTGAVPEAAP